MDIGRAEHGWRAYKPMQSTHLHNRIRPWRTRLTVMPSSDHSRQQLHAWRSTLPRTWPREGGIPRQAAPQRGAARHPSIPPDSGPSLQSKEYSHAHVPGLRVVLCKARQNRGRGGGRPGEGSLGLASWMNRMAVRLHSWSHSASMHSIQASSCNLPRI